MSGVGTGVIVGNELGCCVGDNVGAIIGEELVGVSVGRGVGAETVGACGALVGFREGLELGDSDCFDVVGGEVGPVSRQMVVVEGASPEATVSPSCWIVQLISDGYSPALTVNV